MTPALLLPLLLVTQDPVQLQLSSTSTGEVQVARDGYLLVLGADRKGQAIVSPMEFRVRQAKFQSGAPPAVCNGSVCALSVSWQLGNMYLRDPF